MKTLITGAAGFIGTNLTIECLNKGWEVLAVDIDLEACDRLLIEIEKLDLDKRNNFKLFNCDMVSDGFLQEAKQWQPETILHMAAIPRVSYSVEHPAETTDSNVAKTVRLLEYAQGNDVRRVVFASSSSVYGGAENLPTTEDEVLDPKSPYAMQKMQGEQWMTMFANMYGLDTVSMRFFNVFGPYQYGDSPYATAIAAWCQKLVDNQPLRLDGTGEQSRDLCYVDNVTQACMLAAMRDDDFGGEAYNVACNDRTSLNQILDHFREQGFEFEIENAPFRAGDVMHTQADISKIENDLGYVVKADFWTGLQKTFEWWELK